MKAWGPTDDAEKMMLVLSIVEPKKRESHIMYRAGLAVRAVLGSVARGVGIGAFCMSLLAYHAQCICMAEENDACVNKFNHNVLRMDISWLVRNGAEDPLQAIICGFKDQKAYICSEHWTHAD